MVSATCLLSLTVLVGHVCLNNYAFFLFINVYLLCFCFFIGKAAIDRMTSDMATELSAKNKSIAVISMYPGLVRTEKILDRAKVISSKMSTSLDSQCACLLSISYYSFFIFVHHLIPDFLIILSPTDSRVARTHRYDYSQNCYGNSRGVVETFWSNRNSG